MEIRKATIDDTCIIASIYNQYLGKSSMDTVAKNANYYHAVLEKQSSREGLYVISKENEIKGWGIIKAYSDRHGYRYACETSVYIDQNHLHQGYGNTLKKHIINECRAFDYHHLVAKIFATNEVSINYNLKLGYTIVGTQKEIGFVDGRWKDIVIMQLVL